MDVVHGAADEGDQRQGKQGTQWVYRSSPTVGDVGNVGNAVRELRIAESGGDRAKKSEEVPRASTWLAS
jgi:putative component of toxin-antitoxin plasmid stabilization module